MSSIVLELQQESINKKSDILSLLNKAYLVAKKLKLKDFENWISNELNGYKKNEQIPEYRVVKGEIKAWNPHYGWVPVHILDNDDITKQNIYDSISCLVNVYNNCKNNAIHYSLSPSMNLYFSKKTNFYTEYNLVFDSSRLFSMFEQIRTRILDWAILLEENGILGENLQFNEKEKETAQNTPIINNYMNINNFYGNADNIDIQQNTSNSFQN